MALSEEKLKRLKEAFINEHGPITDEKWDEAVRVCTDWAEFAYDLWKQKVRLEDRVESKHER